MSTFMDTVPYILVHLRVLMAAAMAGSIIAAYDHHGAPRIDGRGQTPEHPGDVIEGHGGKQQIVGFILIGLGLGRGFVQLVAIGEHGPLGKASGSAGELKKTNIVHMEVGRNVFGVSFL